jgi:UDP-N-acetylglucosamine 2-epimerase
VESGWNMLVPSAQLWENQCQVLEFLAAKFEKKQKKNFYGAGNASQKIKKVIQEIL